MVNVLTEKVNECLAIDNDGQQTWDDYCVIVAVNTSQLL